MIHKNLSDIIPLLTSHNVGLKRVLVCNDETESAITQIAVTTLRAGEETDRHKHESMEEYFLFVKGKLFPRVGSIPQPGLQLVSSQGEQFARSVLNLHFP